MPSPELQSPFSWMWKPWAPGARPATFASTSTLSPFWVKRTAPVTLLPLVGSSLATALGPAADELDWLPDREPAQPARERTATMGRRLRMVLLWQRRQMGGPACVSFRAGG